MNDTMVADTNIKSTGLFLNRGQIHTGMTVAIALEGKNIPEADEEGMLLFKILAGGVPTRVKFYPIDEEGKISSGYETFKPEVRFMPTHVFSPEEAPVDTSFVVFVNGERQSYELPYNDNIIYLFKDRDGSILSVNGYAYKWWLKKFPLPMDARLVPISGIGKGRGEYEKFLPEHL